jgi:hypothetical protein
MKSMKRAGKSRQARPEVGCEIVVVGRPQETRKNKDLASHTEIAYGLPA